MRRTYAIRGGKLVEINRANVLRDATLRWNVPDPGAPEIAIPRGFRELEGKMSASAIARGAGYSVRQIKERWNL